MKTRNLLRISVITLLFITILSSCTKEKEKVCDNGLYAPNYIDCKCPIGEIKYPNSNFCDLLVGAGGKYLVEDLPNGFYENYANKVYYNILGSNFISAPWGEPQEVIVGFMKNDFEMEKRIRTEAIAYYLNESTDSFTVDFRKITDEPGYNSNGEGLLLIGTLNGSNPNDDWKWLIVAEEDSLGTQPLQVIPANITR